MKIKYPAVIVAALVHYILGGLWYSPLLFGNKFLQIINWSPEKLAEIERQSHVKELAIALVTSFWFISLLTLFSTLKRQQQWLEFKLPFGCGWVSSLPPRLPLSSSNKDHWAST
jgi:hypothetical protein